MKTFALTRNIDKWRNAKVSLILEECGGDGSCLFYSIAVGASRLLNQTWSMEYVRDRIASSITQDSLKEFLQLMIDDQSQKLLPNATVIDSSYSLQQVQSLISEPGPRFQGTDAVLRWLVDRDPLFSEYGIGFVLFSSFGPEYTEILSEDSANCFIILFNHANSHWQLGNVVDCENRGFSSIGRETVRELKTHL